MTETDPPEATDTADSETKPLDIPGMCAEAGEFMHRSIGTKAGITIAKSRQREQALRQQAQQLRTQHEKRS
jgi:hypothetical protein